MFIYRCFDCTVVIARKIYVLVIKIPALFFGITKMNRFVDTNYVHVFFDNLNLLYDVGGEGVGEGEGEGEGEC